MSWKDSRATGASAATLRRTAHADDAKQRSDEASRVRRPRPRTGRLAPLAVAGALVLLVSGGATAALLARGASDTERTPAAADGRGTDDQPGARAGTPSASSPAPTQDSAEAASDTAPAAFVAVGRDRIVYRNVETGARKVRSGPATLRIDCSSGSCRVTTLGGSDVLADRILAPAGPHRWHVGGTRPRAGCDGNAGAGKPSVDLTLTGTRVRIVMHADGLVSKTGGCSTWIAETTETFTGSRG